MEQREHQVEPLVQDRMHPRDELLAETTPLVRGSELRQAAQQPHSCAPRDPGGLVVRLRLPQLPLPGGLLRLRQAEANRMGADCGHVAVQLLGSPPQAVRAILQWVWCREDRSRLCRPVGGYRLRVRRSQLREEGQLLLVRSGRRPEQTGGLV